jgi:hypothetical protein
MNRPRFLVVLLVGAIAFSMTIGVGLAQFKAAPIDPKLKALSGKYYEGDGLGYNLSLDLEPDGTYSAEWHGCMGLYGSASGTWSIADSHLTFEPRVEDDMMEGHLRKLDIVNVGDNTVLLDKNDWELFRVYGVSRGTCFQRRERINFDQ